MKTYRGFTLSQLQESYYYEPDAGRIHSKKDGTILFPRKGRLSKRDSAGKVVSLSAGIVSVCLFYERIIDESEHLVYADGSRSNLKISNLLLLKHGKDKEKHHTVVPVEVDFPDLDNVHDIYYERKLQKYLVRPYHNSDAVFITSNLNEARKDRDKQKMYTKIYEQDIF